MRHVEEREVFSLGEISEIFDITATRLVSGTGANPS